MAAELGTQASAQRRAPAGRRISELGVLKRVRGAHPATLLMAAAVVLSGGLLLHWLSRLTFWRDEWGILLHRRAWSADSFFHPFVEQLVAIPVLIYKVLVTTFGMDSAAPFQLVSTTLFLLSVVLLFVYVRRRVGEWLALAGALPILFLGPSWDDLLFPFQMAIFGSMACGLGALLALDRRDRAGEVAVMALLTASLLFSDLGIAFVAGVTVDVALSRERVRRAYVVALPTALWGLWYLGWGHTATTFVSFHNFETLPSYVFDAVASSIGTLLGLGTPRSDQTPMTSLDWGRPLLLLAIGLAAWRLHRLGRVPDRLLTVATVAFGFWSLTALNASPLGQPTVGRYQYIGAILIVAVAAELARGVRVGRAAVLIALVIAGFATLSNFSVLRDAGNGLAGLAEQERGGLAALELTRGKVDPGFLLTKENSDVDYLGLVDAGSYFSAIDAYGSPAYTPVELATAPEVARVAADKVFAGALGVKLAPAPGVHAGRCAVARPGAGPVDRRVPPGGLVLRSRSGGLQVALRRYASESFPVELGSLASGRPVLLNVPSDGSAQPWELELTGRGTASICKRSSA